MPATHLAFGSRLEDYEKQAGPARGLAFGRHGGHRLFRHNHPLAGRSDPWLPKRLPEPRSASPRGRGCRSPSPAGASGISRGSRNGWRRSRRSPVEVRNGGGVRDRGRPGDGRFSREDPDLVAARSSIVAPRPAGARATLLHYSARTASRTTGRGPRQRRGRHELLLEAGAEADAVTSMYGGQCTTLACSSRAPRRAGFKSLDRHAGGPWGRGGGARKRPVDLAARPAALVFGFVSAAKYIVRRRARVDDGFRSRVGRLEDARRLLPAAGADDRHRALALAAQLGHVEVVRLLLDTRARPDRYNPKAATPTRLHCTGRHRRPRRVVRLLVEEGRGWTSGRDLQRTPPGWARRRQVEIAGTCEPGGAARSQ